MSNTLPDVKIPKEATKPMPSGVSKKISALPKVSRLFKQQTEFHNQD